MYTHSNYVNEIGKSILDHYTVESIFDCTVEILESAHRCVMVSPEVGSVKPDVRSVRPEGRSEA